MENENDNNILLTNGGDTPYPLKEDNFNTPDNFVQSLKLSQGHRSCKDVLLNCLCWFFSIVVWALIGLIIYYNLYEENENRLRKCKICLAFYYTVYIILQAYFSPTFKYLLHKEKLPFNEKMGEIFQMKPEVIFINQEYHYETRTYTYTNDDGNTKTGEYTVRAWGNKIKDSMEYKSFRDISGLLTLNCGNTKK